MTSCAAVNHETPWRPLHQHHTLLPSSMISHAPDMNSSRGIIMCLLVLAGTNACAALSLQNPAGARSLLQQPWHAWVTPKTSCLEACRSIAPGWRPATGGQSCKEADRTRCMKATTMVLCAGLIDMPGLGRQWVAGGTAAAQSLCTIKCPTEPCWNLPPGVTRHQDWVFAGVPNKYRTAGGELKAQDTPFPVKCACVSCPDDDAACEDALWVESAQSTNCPPSLIQPQAGETFPISMHGGICRGNEASSGKGWTGWVDAAVSPSVCRRTLADSESYSVWCAR